MKIKINWIDLSEQQPQKDQYVLCYSENTGIKMDTYEFSKGGIHWFYGNKKENDISITHWSNDIIVRPNDR